MRKSGIAHTENLLPSHAPPDFQNRSALWNSVEKIEKSKNSQLAGEIELAIPKELPPEQQIELVREYVKDNFVSAGMCADIAIHDKNDGNPHAHIMLTMRPLNENGEWGAKSKKEYITDKNGERIKLKNGNFKTKKVDTVDWNEQSKAELWRSKWAELANKYLEQNFIADRIDHRSFERQGTEQIPTIHLGVAASQMERKGITTERGNINREIKAHNRILAEIKAKIASLKNWLADIFKRREKQPPEQNLIEILQELSKPQKINMQYRIYNPKKLAEQIQYLQDNKIFTIPQLDETVNSVCDEYDNIRITLKEVEGSLKSLAEFVSIIGSSGCGKSTLLSIPEGIGSPTAGTVLIDGKPISGTGFDRGVVFQHYSLFPWMTARNNVAFGIKQVKKELKKMNGLKSPPSS